ncbi:MAG: M20/M25/M40 family metallo-hydrolase [Candidatus Bathyarchaeota archaeon]|nr:M20/M25/M40 family metallo-hydrolase [Candidatus Bathyarchaeota archaeon]
MNPSQVYAKIDENRETSINRLRELVKVYPQGEQELQDKVAELFEEVGCKVDYLKLLPTTVQLHKEFAVEEAIDMTKRIHIIGKIEGTGNGKSLILITHPDADPIDPKGWNIPLHEGIIKDGRMYGWAVADDLAGICMMTEAVEALNESGFKPKGDVYLMSASAKRNAWGIAALLREGYKADAALYVHPAESELGLKEIKTMTSGLLKFRIVIEGMWPPKTEFVQVTFNHLGVNPIDKAMYVIDSLKRFNEERIRTVVYEPLNKEVGRGTNLLVTYINAGKPSNLTDLPVNCTIGVGLTFPPHEDIDELVKKVEKYIQEVSMGDPWLKEHPAKIEWIQGTQGVEMPMDHPIVETISDAIEDVTGERPFSNPLYSKSDLRTPVLISNIPNVGYGPLAGDLSTTGGFEEWVDLDDYIRGIKVTARAIMDWCG